MLLWAHAQIAHRGADKLSRAATVRPITRLAQPIDISHPSARNTGRGNTTTSANGYEQWFFLEHARTNWSTDRLTAHSTPCHNQDGHRSSKPASVPKAPAKRGEVRTSKPGDRQANTQIVVIRSTSRPTTERNNASRRTLDSSVPSGDHKHIPPTSVPRAPTTRGGSRDKLCRL